MTTEELLNRQGADITALRLALKDLARSMPSEQRFEWLSTLHARIARIEKDAGAALADPTTDVKAMASALESLHAALSRD